MEIDEKARSSRARERGADFEKSTMLQEGKAQVVRCGDLNCKLCTATKPGENLSNERTYEVYTCESPMCSLCREEPDLLLDLFCPFNSIEDIAEIARKISNITGMEGNDGDQTISLSGQADRGNSPQETTRWDERTTNNICHNAVSHEGSSIIRDLLQNTPRSNVSELDTAQNFMDESCLLDLESEFEVDKLNYLPDLREEGVMDYWTD